MIVPIRCWTCGRPLGHLWEPILKRLSELQQQGKEIREEDIERIFDELGVTRYCCRRTLLGHIELIDQVLEYSGIKSE
nr:MAG: DNA-directed RNA polymerase subunit N [Vulcanisaeta sp. AZ3]